MNENTRSVPLTMRVVASDLVYQAMKNNPQIYLLIGDLGYKMWDKVRADFPERVLNTGAAEQTLMGVAVGIALAGKIPIVYSITPFLLYRPFETIRNYLNYEKIAVKLLAAGRDKDYEHDGISHWSEDDKDVLALWPNIKAYWPQSHTELPGIFENMINSPSPYYVNLKRAL